VLSERVTVRSTIAILSTAIGETAFGAAGVSENMANERGFVFVTGTFEGGVFNSRHDLLMVSPSYAKIRIGFTVCKNS